MNCPRPQAVEPRRARHLRAERNDVIATETRSVSRRTWWSRARRCAGALVLGAVVARLGTGPFVDGLRRTDPSALLAAAMITTMTTACCAWRWRLVAHGLGLSLGRRAALAAVFRSQFLNATLPGGIVGDVDRAVGDGSSLRGPGARSVVWERVLGQVVQIALTVAVLATLPSSLRSLGLAAACLIAAGVLLTVARHRWSSHRVAGSTRRTIRVDLLRILSRAGAGRAITIASALAVCGHLAVFVLAARVAGVPLGSPGLLPAAALVLLASGIPLNVAGWGPREGVAAWAFGATGLGAAAGVTTAVVYGVMALVATLPGAAVLLLGRRPSFPPGRPARVLDGGPHG